MACVGQGGAEAKSGRLVSRWTGIKIRMTNRLSVRSALACATLFLALGAQAHADKRIALVIGNNDYKYVPKLQKAVNDARTMGDTLKQLGFSVMVAENQTRQAFSETLLAFDKKSSPAIPRSSSM